MPWRDVDFEDEFESYDHHNPYKTVGSFLAETLRISRLFTIAAEPGYSCGLRGVVRILAGFAEVLSREDIELQY